MSKSRSNKALQRSVLGVHAACITGKPLSIFALPLSAIVLGAIT